jgi:hypothetical protein
MFRTGGGRALRGEVHVHEGGGDLGKGAHDGQYRQQREGYGGEAADHELPARDRVPEQDVYGAALLRAGYGAGRRQDREESERQRGQQKDLGVHVVLDVGEVRDPERLEHPLRVRF